MKKRNFLFLLLSGLMWLGAPQAAEDPRDPYRYFFNETWHDYQEELKHAREQGKKGIMIFFEMDECPFCHYMKTNVFNQPAVQQYFRDNFLLFSVDIEGDVEMKNMQGKSMTQKEFAFKEHRVRATPVMAFFDLSGKKIHHHIGKVTGVDEFMLMGEYVATGAYQSMPFIRFKQSRQTPSK